MAANCPIGAKAYRSMKPCSGKKKHSQEYDVWNVSNKQPQSRLITTCKVQAGSCCSSNRTVRPPGHIDRPDGATDAVEILAAVRASDRSPAARRALVGQSADARVRRCAA
eukprot:2631193-Pleurochrysis_carterae.AAC.1